MSTLSIEKENVSDKMEKVSLKVSEAKTFIVLSLSSITLQSRHKNVQSTVWASNYNATR